MLNKKLWETSGHWYHYKENMYTSMIDEVEFALKPMNCPGGMLVYKSEAHSYRDFPMRVGELGRVHRHELSGALHGLMRVRAFTQDDAHIFMLPSQIKLEIKGVISLIDQVYSKFGFKYSLELSTRPDDSMGSDEDWELAEDSLKSALDELNLDYNVNEGDGAFYGPKIEKITLKPEAKVITQGAKGFFKIFGKQKKFQGLLDWCISVIIKAKEQGYDVVEFERQVDVGTVIINQDVAIRNYNS